MTTEVAGKADFSGIRYAQCWEDADILVKALNLKPGFRALSISSAGDNTFALLAHNPKKVVAVDLSAAQLYCLQLRAAAYSELSHPELLELIGSRESTRRAELYRQCRQELSSDARAFWDLNSAAIESGIGSAGKFENYFRLFRERALPLIHKHSTVEALLQPKDRSAREAFYQGHWNTWRWRLLFKVFFSRAMMGRLGRDPSFFAYVEGSVADRILERARYALIELSPADNPYLHWILTGTHGTALPYALRAENFEAIRSNLDKLEWRKASLEDALADAGPNYFDAYNLSDIFEYMSEANTASLLEKLASGGRPGARLAYWNMLAPRKRPESLSHCLEHLADVSNQLFLQDKAFFYSAFVVEEVTG
jgi:S-adenosylmethionine-diacylglycerol 3-amino-3-carboxypropyl transferase